MKRGLTLSSEEHGPKELVDNARLAEERGFDFVSISDHYHPWISEQGRSPFVWSVLGAMVEVVAPEMIAESIPCGPDPEPIVTSIRDAATSGADHIYLHQIGPDRRGFVDFFEREARPGL